ncbi:DUF1707 and DUF4190 domain-containing protein [Micromonospora sp. CPCC 206061]|uniref:DUF1707 and DUF4190 domain-containing protein n=1 Tax=Micromonospora sp. CPCC 206061 TaxID=3122410 RepID=UPI002FF33D90
MSERIGNVQRTHVLDLLSRALEEGYLGLDEYEQRMSATTSAKTANELRAQTSDLPPQFQWDPRHQVSTTAHTGNPDRNAHVTSVVSLILAIVSIPLAVCFGIGILFGVAAVVLSRPGLRTRTEYGKALAGLVVGCVGIVSSLVMIALFIFMPSSP